MSTPDMRERPILFSAPTQAVDGPYIEIRDVLPVPFYRYPNVREDVRRLANECADFIVRRNLESYVQDLEAA